MVDVTELVLTLPFPVALTEPDGRMIEQNIFFRQMVRGDHSKGTIRDYFTNWEKIGANVINAKLDQQTITLFCHEYVLHDHRYTLYTIPKPNIDELFVSVDLKYKALNQFVDALIEHTVDVIYVTDRYGNTLNVSPSIKKFFGCPREYFIGKNVHEFVRKGKFRESMTVEVLKKKHTVNSVVELDSSKLKTAIPVTNEHGEVDKVITFVRNLTELNRIHDELNNALKMNVEYKNIRSHRKEPYVVKSPQIKEVFGAAERLANVDATILILGETGVGKEILTNYLFEKSERASKGKLIKVNCGAFPTDLLEAELFGYEAGAFTGASMKGKAGLFEVAHNGILFLDEIGELPMDLQVKLLRLLQEKQVQRIGATETKNVNVKLVAATNRDLLQMVEEGQFREDLYYRLNVLPLTIPPLRERREDILPLIQYYNEKYNRKYKVFKSFSSELRAFFMEYNWPGNIRELSNLIERLTLTVPREQVAITDLPEEYLRKRSLKLSLNEPVQYEQTVNKETIRPLKEVVEEAEYQVLSNALMKFDSTYKIAKELETSQTTIVRKLKKYKLQMTE